MLGLEIDRCVKVWSDRLLPQARRGTLSLTLAARAYGVNGILEQFAQENISITIVDVIAENPEHCSTIEFESEIHRTEMSSGNSPIESQKVQPVALRNVAGRNVERPSNLILT